MFSWVERRDATCETHGPQSFVVTPEGDALCPECLCAMIDPVQHVDKRPDDDRYDKYMASTDPEHPDFDDT
jgi:hypothetical protein